MVFDTHCHLNFSAFETDAADVITEAKQKGVGYFVVPGTDVETSKKAIAIAEKYENTYAAVGIHPHHLFEIKQSAIDSARHFIPASAREKLCAVGIPFMSATYRELLKQIEKLLTHNKVVAIGEIGVDRHYYRSTKYKNYNIDESFINLQKEFLTAQIELAVKHEKSLILHNREAKKDLLEILTNHQPLITNHRIVFHCCEPDYELLAFAKKHHIFIGVDGDITYYEKKQEFVKQIPLELLVLETDSPYLLPEPFRSQKKRNKPENLILIAQFIAELKQISVEKLTETTTYNAKRLFQIPL